MERVRRTIRIVAAVGTTAVFGFNMVPNVFPATVKFLQSVPDSAIPSSAPGERYQRLLNEVCCKMNVDSDKIHLFYNNGLSSLCSGCLQFPGQCVIGLPRNWLYGTVEDLGRASMTFEKKTINWDSKTGKDLIDVLLLVSDEHIKFRMAHELAHIKDKHFVPMTVHATSFCVVAYKIGTHFSKSQGSIFRILLTQALVWAIAFMLYLPTRQELSHWKEYAADERAARLGVDYADGGVDFMQRYLKLNRVMRKVNGEKGETMFSEVGDDLQMYTHPKRTDRLKKIMEIKEEFGGDIAE